ncbi:putative nuclease YhcG [Methanosarcinaceae archaeon Ag5]|uniref:Nuclease YhcG n=2 Tax=Methanolapillus africanus TaxID=3028297 RepID=A0AAE4SCH7_9EURY|nr:putative nuclease YhcG [Methanosarcinaceae archaeon Ag5]
MSHDIIPYADAIIHMIEESRLNVLKSVNAELIKLYWRVGEYLSNESSKSLWGSSFIDETARRIRENNPEIKGFDRRNLYRMKQFYETYKDNEFVSPLVTQISWTNHLLILSNTKSMEEKEFYIKLCLQEKYSKRELERQFGSCYYERYLLSSKKTASTMLPENIKNGFFDKYVLEFLDLPDGYSENDFKKAIIQNLKNFLLELGRDFSFIGEEYRIQVGDTDFYIDLLFYHRALSCLVAFELKIDNFKPEYLGKMNFYLESLDREHKKPNENPSIGVILCATKNDEIVEYAMSKSLSPALVSEYTLQLIDKKLLERKLREFKELIPENKTDILNK